jgi:hypothetical protein
VVGVEGEGFFPKRIGPVGRLQTRAAGGKTVTAAASAHPSHPHQAGPLRRARCPTVKRKAHTRDRDPRRRRKV